MFENASPPLKLSAQQARNLHLAAQGVLRKPPARARRADVVAAIERMRLLQIDTIHVVARSPYLVLFSRLGSYPLEWLDEALERGDIFERWSHEACFVPACDFPLHQAHYACGGRRGHWADRHAARTHDTQRAGMDALLAHIRTHGPVKASDFVGTRPATTGWWDWKDEKRWLEALFARGELMVSRREKFRRVYDLSERVLARAGVARSTAMADESRITEELILASVKALGISQARWIADYYRTGRKHKDTDLAGLVASGNLLEVEVEGWSAVGYVHGDHEALLQRAMSGRLRATHTTLLSPFDPVVWDRARASAMFGFDYTIECYVPEARRRYGYFALPILHRGGLIGRLDAKAHRAAGVFEIRQFHVEAGVKADSTILDAVAGAIQACADWHQTPQVRIRRSDPRGLAVQLRLALGEL